LASDQTTVGSLPHRLAYEVSFDRASLDYVKNRPQRASKPEALRGLYVALGQVSIVEYENARDFAGASEIRRNRHVKLRWIQIRQIVQAKRRVMTVYTLDCFVPVPGPQCPKDKVWPINRRKENQAVDTAVLANPVPCLHMIGVRVFGESSRLGLLGGEETLLLLSGLEEPPRCFTMRLGHNTILQLYRGYIKVKVSRAG